MYYKIKDKKKLYKLKLRLTFGLTEKSNKDELKK